MSEPTLPPAAPTGWPTPTPNPKRSGRWKPWVVGGAAAVIVLLAIGAFSSNPEDEPTAAVVATATASSATPDATPAPTPTPTPDPTQAPTPEPTPKDYDAAFSAAIADDDCSALSDLASEMPSADEEWPITDETLAAAGAAMTACVNGGSTVSKMVPRGDTAVAGQQGTWKIKVNGKVNFDAWRIVKRENMFNDPAPSGYKMVMIPLSFTNVGEEKDDLLGLGEYVVGDATGVEIVDFEDPSCGVIPREVDFGTNVRPGGTIKGNMCFVVPKEDLATLRFAVPAGSFSGADVEFALR